MHMEKVNAGETCNVGEGHALEIQEFLDRIFFMSSTDICSQVDPAKLRPVDVPVIEPDVSRLKAATGWKLQIPFSQTVKETLE